VDVEAHVLRYWEEDLELEIFRTELGHRCYTKEDIRIFQKIKEMKERGLQLKAIKVLIPELKRRTEDTEKVETLPALHPDLDKVKQFEQMVTDIFRQVLQENNHELEMRITDSMVKEVEVLMERKEEREEERFRQLDETIRAYQKNRQLVASAKEPEGRKRRKRFSLFR
jgi:DNA-binding transcriptional MerR regulator